MPSSQQYDPANPQPYQAPQLPDVVSPVVQQAEQKEQNNQPNIQRGPMNQLGGWAEVGDNIFRGYMRGRAEKTVQDAIKFKRQDDSLRWSYGLAAQNLKGMIDSGALPPMDVQQVQAIRAGKVPDGMTAEQFQMAQQAVGAVDGSWGALMQLRGAHIPGQDDGKGKKGGKKKQDGQPNIISQLGSDDPAEKLQGIYAATMKLGAPVYYQLGNTQLAKTERDITSLRAQNALTGEQKTARINELQMKANLTPEEQQELVRLSTKPVQPQPGDEKLLTQDQIYKKIRSGEQLSNDEKEIIGLGPKSDAKISKTGEIIAVTKNADGTVDYEIKRPSQPEYESKTGAGKTGAQKKIPADITNNKNKAFAAAQQLYLHGDEDSDDPKKKKLTFEDFTNKIQEAQDNYEQRIQDVTGEPVEHVNVADHLTKNGGWDWHGKKPMEQIAGFPDPLHPQKPTAGVSASSSQNEEELPPEIAKQLKPGFISTLSNGSRWTIRKGKPFQVSAPQQ